MAWEAETASRINQGVVSRHPPFYEGNPPMAKKKPALQPRQPLQPALGSQQPQQQPPASTPASDTTPAPEPQEGQQEPLEAPSTSPPAEPPAPVAPAPASPTPAAPSPAAPLRGKPYIDPDRPPTPEADNPPAVTSSPQISPIPLSSSQESPPIKIPTSIMQDGGELPITIWEQLESAKKTARRTGQRIRKVFNKQAFIRQFPAAGSDPRMAFTPDTFILDVTPLETMTVGELRNLCLACKAHPLALQKAMQVEGYADNHVIRLLREEVQILRNAAKQ